MPELTRTEAERLLVGLRKRRQQAIDEGDLSELDRLDERISQIEAAVETVEAPPSSGIRWGRLGIVGAIALIGLIVSVGDTPQPAQVVEPVRPQPVPMQVAAEPIEAAEAQSKWIKTQTVSEFDDSRNVYLTLNADFPVAGRYGAVTPTLVVRCRESTTSAIIDWKQYLGLDETTVEYRVDDAPARTQRWGISTNNESAGLWYGGSAIPFAKSIAEANRLVARVTPYGENTVAATFTVAGLGRELSEVAEACGWSYTAP